MAVAIGQPTHPLTTDPSDGLSDFLARLSQELLSWDFFSAVRRIDCLSPQNPRTGESDSPAQDAIRFGQIPSLIFAPADMAELKPPRPGTSAALRPPLKLLIHFFGLLGPNGPLPICFTDYIRNRKVLEEDPALAEFLDVFHHRMISLFYRAWAQANQAVQFDRDALHEPDRFADYLGSLCGWGSNELRALGLVEDIAKLDFAGRLVCQTRNVEGLEAILSEYFGFEVTVQEFVGEWVNIPEQHRCRLTSNARNTCLGEPPFDPLADPDAESRPSEAIVGDATWQRQHKFRIVLGPLSFEQYQRMLPGGASIARLLSWVRIYVGDELEWDVRLVLRAVAVPQARLGMIGQLGMSAWLLTAPVTHDATDLLLSADRCREATVLSN